MGYLDESNQISKALESENAATNNGDEAIVHPAIDHDDSIQFDTNNKLSSFTSGSSSRSSDFSLQDLQILDSEYDENHNENVSDSGNPSIQLMEHSETCRYGIPSHVSASTIFTGPGNWSMASNESLFSIHMGGTSFCRLDSCFSPVFNLPHDSQFVDGKILEMDEEENDQESSTPNEEPTYKEDDKKCHLSATSSSSSSSSSSFVFPILSGGTEKGGSPYPRGLLIGPVPQSPPKLEPAPEPRQEPTASDDKAEAEEITTSIAWTKWFPCFRTCACCS